MALFSRRENPPTYSNYREYKPFLRRDFLARCAYCERPEQYLGGDEVFEVEHFRPKGKFPALLCAYNNLYYVCRPCNGHKSETWPSEVQIAKGLKFSDPCAEDPYVHHLLEREDGGLQELTPCGRYSNGHIRLDRSELRTWRRLRNQARRDLPRLTAVARLLEHFTLHSEGSENEEAKQQLDALRRFIEESKARFSID